MSSCPCVCFVFVNVFITNCKVWWLLTQLLLQSLLSEELTFVNLRQEQKFPTIVRDCGF